MVFPFQIITDSAEKTQEFGQAYAHTLLSGEENLPHVLALWGELGSGKTTFVQGVARGLSILTRLPSPTFIIVRRYQLHAPGTYFYHMDAYRLHGPEDADTLGFSEMVSDPNAYLAIEWPERLGSRLPVRRIDIRFTVNGDGTHVIEGSIHG